MNRAKAFLLFLVAQNALLLAISFTLPEPACFFVAMIAGLNLGYHAGDLTSP